MGCRVPFFGVVFDTNVYRSLGVARFAALRERERDCSAIGYASYAVALELLSHQADPSDLDAGPALAGLGRMWEHCSQYDGASHILRFVAEALDQIAFALFGRPLRGATDPTSYGLLVGSFLHEPENRHTWQPALEALARGAQEMRERYVQTLWRNVVQTLAPNAKSWADLAGNSPVKAALLEKVAVGEDLPLIAQNIASHAAGEAQVALPPDELATHAATVLRLFPTLVYYRSLVVRELIERGPDMSRRHRANGALDLQVCCTTTGTASLNGRPLFLVTDDDVILRAAKLGGTRHRILRLPEYQALIDPGFRGLEERIEALATIA